MAFVCFHDPEQPKHGVEAATKALQELNGRELGENFKLYIREALKKSEREAQIMRDSRKFKNSKKRCNLYVKGFDETVTEEDLKTLFSNYGEIESMRFFPGEDTRKPYAFICYKAPDQATQAKNDLTQQTEQTAKPLIINHYEIKE